MVPTVQRWCGCKNGRWHQHRRCICAGQFYKKTNERCKPMGRFEFENDIAELIGFASIRSQPIIVKSVSTKSSRSNRILTMVHIASKFESNIAERIDAQLIHTGRTKCKHPIGTIVCQWKRFDTHIVPKTVFGLAQPRKIITTPYTT